MQDGSQILHVDGLTRNVTKQHLLEIFSIFGPLTTVDLAVDLAAGLSNGWAHIEFTTKKDAEEAQLRMDGVSGQLTFSIQQRRIAMMS
jgi:RNA-binding protein with serine-rich domain 1